MIVNIPPAMDPRIQPNMLTRNGKPVSTTVEVATQRLANQVLAYEGKELFSQLAIVPAIDSDGGGGPRNRWYFRARTSPHVRFIRVVMRAALQSAQEVPEQPVVRFELLDANDDLIGAVEHAYGSTLIMASPPDTPNTWSTVVSDIAVEGRQEVWGVFMELDYARLVSALVYELGPEPDTDNGYLGPSPAQGTNIYDDERERLANVANDTWMEGAAHTFNLNCNDDGSPYVLTSPSFPDDIDPTNIIDQTSTAISASTPGFFFDGTGKALSRADDEVELVMWAYGSSSDESYVELKDSDGDVMATVALTPVLGWRTSGTFTLPASSAKYDLHLHTPTHDESATLYAVSIYEKGDPIMATLATATMSGAGVINENEDPWAAVLTAIGPYTGKAGNSLKLNVAVGLLSGTPGGDAIELRDGERYDTDDEMWVPAADTVGVAIDFDIDPTISIDDLEAALNAGSAWLEVTTPDPFAGDIHDSQPTYETEGTFSGGFG